MRERGRGRDPNSKAGKEEEEGRKRDYLREEGQTERGIVRERD